MSQGNACAQIAAGVTTPSAEEIAFSNITDVGIELFNLIAVPGSTGAVISEDCLYLNVWTKPQSGEALKAVMVFIHGGGFTGGSASNQPIFDGSSLADQKDLVIVTLK